MEDYKPTRAERHAIHLYKLESEKVKRLLTALRKIADVPNRYDVCPKIAMEMYEIAHTLLRELEG